MVVMTLAVVAVWVLVPRSTVLFEADGAFGPVRVLERPDGLRELYIGEGRSRQSAAYPDDPMQLVLDYTRVAMIGPALVADDARVLIVGLGGGVMPSYLARVRPRMELEAVEIDPVVVRAAREQFGLREGPGLIVHVADGRGFIEEAEPGRWDLIVLDAFSDTDIPRALATQEFLHAVRDALAAGGVVVSNVPTSPPEYPAMVATYRAVFGAVQRMRVAGRLQHILIAAADSSAVATARLARAASEWPSPDSVGYDLRDLVPDALVTEAPPAAAPLRDGG